MKILILGVSLLALTGCATREKIVRHDVMVTVPCKISVPNKPVMPLTNNASRKDPVDVKTAKALAEIEVRKAYEKKLEAAARSCE